MEIPPEVKEFWIKELVRARMEGYQDGLIRGVLLAEHFTGVNLDEIRSSIRESWDTA